MDLRELKQDLSRAFIGQGGVHGVGLNLAKQAIRVYVDLQPHPDQMMVLEKLKTAAAPFPVIVVSEEAPQAQ